jgi:hypothetical protein
MSQPDPIPLPPANTLELPHTPPPEETTPMLDVHPAHHAAGTWREFMIHIATIVLGLLIAIGLEQTVEYFHHRHQVAETREALRREHDYNVRLFAIKLDEFRRFTPILQTNLAVFLYLQKHPGAPEKDLPGKLFWFNLTVSYVDAAWKTAQQNNVLALMPDDEVRKYSDLYYRLENLRDTSFALRTAIYNARSFTIVEPNPSHLSLAEVDKQVELTKNLLRDQLLNGAAQISIKGRFPEFPAPTPADLNQITHVSTEQEANPELSDLQKKVAVIIAEANSSGTYNEK